MKYFVKIDKDSIRLNKNAGSRSTFINGPVNITFACSELPELFKNNEDVIVVKENFITQEGTSSESIYEGVIYHPKIMEEILEDTKEMKRCNLVIERENLGHIMNHPPVAKYSFEYMNTLIMCDSCKEKIKTDDLEECTFYYLENMCPKCGKADCCELEYEEIGDIKKEE